MTEIHNAEIKIRIKEMNTFKYADRKKIPQTANLNQKILCQVSDISKQQHVTM